PVRPLRHLSTGTGRLAELPSDCKGLTLLILGYRAAQICPILRRMTRKALLTALLLTACASAPVYGPSDGNSFGYREQIIETGRFRVSYFADDRQEADNGALRRAAELTLQEGFDHFIVTSQSSETERQAPRSSVGIGGGTGGRRSGFGLGVSVPIGETSEEVTTWLEIVMGAGPKPADAIQAYDAQETLNNLRGPLGNTSLSAEDPQG
ncbi:MAG: hypothetical protein AAF511_10920, partial [Pseudomonadota bacterium]